MKSLIARLIDKVGYAVIPHWRMDKLSLANLLREIFAQHQIDTVLDIGANKGQFVEFLRLHVGYCGEIYSFEPIPENIAHLQSLARQDSKWEIVDCALGRENRVLELNVMKADVFSSFLKPNKTSASLFKEWNEIDHSIQVEVKRLEDVLDAKGISPHQRRIFMKTDTQGYDLDVIAGCGQYMQLMRAIQTEVSVIGIYESMPTMFESFGVLGELDFDIAGLFPVSQDKNLRVVEFDAVFVNNRFNL